MKTTTNSLFLRDEDLRQGIELLFFAYRDSTAEADATLSAYGLGRAHHRVLYFVGRNPGIAVSDLLSILKITKQSLSRIISPLVRDGFIAQRAGTEDRRQRLLTLTPSGEELERRIGEPQRARFAAAYRLAGEQAVAGFRQVMMRLSDLNGA